MKIYTKTGDKGTSALYNGERRSKEDPIFEALGATDELSSSLGLAREYCSLNHQDQIVEQIDEIQCLLQDIGSNIATPRKSSSKLRLERTIFDSNGEFIKNLENWIDEMDNELPKLSKFILPSGGLSSASLHMSRSICRRAERRIHPLVFSSQVDSSAGMYLNRLSDYLFQAARFVAMKEGKQETIYIRKDHIGKLKE